MNLKEMIEAKLKEMRSIAELAKSESRDLTDEEFASIEVKEAEVTELKAQLARAEKSTALFGRLFTADAAEPVVEPAAKSLGEHFVKSVGDKIKGSKDSSFSIVAPEFKAASDVHVTPGSIAPALVQVDTNIVTGVRRRLTVADLLGAETISGNALTYFVEGALEGDFAGVAENGQKPQLHYADPTAVTESLKKIAAFIKESDEIREDAPWLVSAINSRLLYNLGLFEENQLLSGSGTGNNLAGLLNRSGIQTQATASAGGQADAIFSAITKVSTGSGLDADGIIIHPTDYQALRLSKDGNGQYFGGGVFAGQYGQGGIIRQPDLWGLPTVVTPAIAAGTALVGAFSQAASVIRKSGMTVEAGYDGNDFTNNRITIRAEERVALAVRRPSALVKVNLTVS